MHLKSDIKNIGNSDDRSLGMLAFLFIEDDISKDIPFLEPIINCINV
jgi:hypothetical protein